MRQGKEMVEGKMAATKNLKNKNYLIKMPLKILNTSNWNLPKVGKGQNFAENRTTCMHRKRKPCMAALLQLILSHAAWFAVFVWHWTSMLWSTDTCQNKVSTDQYHMTIWWAIFFFELSTDQVLVLIGSQAQDRLIYFN